MIRPIAMSIPRGIARPRSLPQTAAAQSIEEMGNWTQQRESRRQAGGRALTAATRWIGWTAATTAGGDGDRRPSQPQRCPPRRNCSGPAMVRTRAPRVHRAATDPTRRPAPTTIGPRRKFLRGTEARNDRRAGIRPRRARTWGTRSFPDAWTGTVEELGQDPYTIRLSLNDDGTRHRGLHGVRLLERTGPAFRPPVRVSRDGDRGSRRLRRRLCPASPQARPCCSGPGRTTAARSVRPRRCGVARRGPAPARRCGDADGPGP